MATPGEMGMQHLAAAAGGLGDAASMDAGADKLHQAGLLGIVTSSMAVTLAVRDPPAGLNTNAYYLALTGAFFGGVAGITAAACLSNNPRARTSAGRKLMWASVVGSLAVVVGLSAAASLLW